MKSEAIINNQGPTPSQNNHFVFVVEKSRTKPKTDNDRNMIAYAKVAPLEYLLVCRILSTFSRKRVPIYRSKIKKMMEMTFCIWELVG